jgi:uncharacterized protein (DUF305 family)
MQQRIPCSIGCASGSFHTTSPTTEQLAALTGPAFEAQFLDVMIFHYKGAIEMANEAWVRACACLPTRYAIPRLHRSSG